MVKEYKSKSSRCSVSLGSNQALTLKEVKTKDIWSTMTA